MNIRVALIAIAFTGASAHALAMEGSTVANPQSTPVEDYAYAITRISPKFSRLRKFPMYAARFR